MFTLLKPGSSTHKPVVIIDLFPTLAELIGENAPAYLDGESLVPTHLRNTYLEPVSDPGCNKFHYT